MIIYLVLLLIVVLLDFLSIKKDRGLGIIAYFTQFLFFVGIAVLFEKSGYDATFYKALFYRSEIAYEFIEPGYLLLNKIGSILTKDYNLYYIIVALIVNGLLFTSITKLGYIPFAPFLFFCKYYFPANFQILRQSIAILLGLMALIQLLHKRKTAYYLIVLVAATFHISALLLLVYPLFVKILTKKYFDYYFLILAIIVGLVVTDFVSVLSNMGLPKLDLYLIGEFSYKGNIIALLANASVALITRAITREDDEKRMIWKFFFFGLLVNIAFNEFGVMAHRHSRMFYVVEIFLLPQLFKGKSKYIILSIILVYGYLFYFRFIYAMDGVGLRLIRLGV